MTVNLRRPLERDFIPGRRMMYRLQQVVYCGRSSTGGFIVEYADHDAWVKRVPVQAHDKNGKVITVYEEYAAWVAKTNKK